LYHVVDDEALKKVLSSVHRILKPEGVFIFSDNFIHNKRYSITHQNCRTLASYEIMLKENGFEIIDRVPNYVLFNDPVDAKGKFYPRLWNLITGLSKNGNGLIQLSGLFYTRLSFFNINYERISCTGIYDL